MISLLRTTFLIATLILVGVTVGLMKLRTDESGAYRITFTSTRTGYREIYVMTSAGTQVRQLTEFPRDDSHWWYSYPHWNYEKECINFNYRQGNYCLDIGYTPTLELTSEIPRYFWPGNIDYASEFSYTRKDDGDWFIFRADDMGLYRAHPDGTDLKKLSNRSVSSVFYLSGFKQVLFFSDGWYIVSLNGGNEMFLETVTEAMYVVPSPNEQLVVSSMDSPRWINNKDVYRYKIIRSRSEQISYVDVYSRRRPFWSPDSRYLFYEGDKGLHCFDTMLQTDHLILPNNDLPLQDWSFDSHKTYEFEYEWSPDSQVLLIIFYGDIYVMRYDGSQIVNITDNPALNNTSIPPLQFHGIHNKNAHWSPDGKWIVFQSESRYMTSEIFRVRPDGSDLQNLTNDPNWDVTPYWVPFEGRSWTPNYLLTGSVLGIVVMLFSSAVRRRLRARRNFA